jgi:hypothetical protein
VGKGGGGGEGKRSDTLSFSQSFLKNGFFMNEANDPFLEQGQAFLLMLVVP